MIQNYIRTYMMLYYKNKQKNAHKITNYTAVF